MSPHKTEPDPHGPPTGRLAYLFFTFVIAVAFVGLFIGMRHAVSPAPAPTHDGPTADADAGDTLPATPYWQIHRGNLGPNAKWYASLDVAGLTPDEIIAVTPGSDADKAHALLMRSSRRAYNGAPPTIPHAIDPMDTTSCVVCHGQGMRIGDVVARPMPHELYASCTQCHVPQQELVADEIHWLINSFEGLAAPEAGSRAYTGAPPIIPHTTQLRTNCMSCHGPLGLSGMRSSHPWRTSCTQCHAPSAELDHTPAAGDTLPLFLTPAWEE